MEYRDLLLVICSLGAAQSFFWGIYFLSSPKLKRGLLLLGILFLLIGVRVAKSTLYLFADTLDIVAMNVGFAAHFATGPLLWHYLIFERKKSPSPLQLLHYLPALAVLFSSPFLDLQGFWYKGAYSILLFQSIIYWGLSLFELRRQAYVLSKKKKLWDLLLLIGVGVLLITYFTNYILGFNPYFLAPLLYSFVIYVLSFFLIKNSGAIFNPSGPKYSNLKASKTELERYSNRIIEHLEDGQRYISNSYSLTMLSKETGIAKHLLSATFSEVLNKNFTEYINSKRIEIAKVKLQEESHLTISSIAYDCGFNTLSSFNSAFKKFVGETPSSFRSKFQTNT